MTVSEYKAFWAGWNDRAKGFYQPERFTTTGEKDAYEKGWEVKPAHE